MNELRWKCWPVLAWLQRETPWTDSKRLGWTFVLWHLPHTNELLASLSCTSLGKGQVSSTAQQLPEEVTGQEGHGPAALEPGRPLVWKLSRQ